MSDQNEIVDANGEIIHVSSDDSADGVRMVQDGQQIILVDEDALAAFTSRTGLTLEDLEPVRSLVTGGNLANVPQFGQYGDVQFQSIDAQNLKVGSFPEARALAEAYFQNFYKDSADQVERVYHGIDTGKIVAPDTMASYLDSDGNIAADVTTVGSEFQSATGAITSNDLGELDSHGEDETDSATSPDDGDGDATPAPDPTDEYRTNF